MTKPASNGDDVVRQPTIMELNSFFKLDGFDFHIKTIGEPADIQARFLKWVTWLIDLGAEPGKPGVAKAQPGETAYFCKYHQDKQMNNRANMKRPANWKSAWKGYFCSFNWIDGHGEKRWCNYELDESGKEVAKNEGDYD
jgi:hypothetical protein